MRKILFVIIAISGGWMQGAEASTINMPDTTCNNQECAGGTGMRNWGEKKIMEATNCSSYYHTRDPNGSFCSVRTFGAVYKIKVTETNFSGSGENYSQTFCFTFTRVSGSYHQSTVVSCPQTEHAAVWWNTSCMGAPAMVFSSISLALTSSAQTYKVFLSVDGEYELPIGGWCYAIAAIGGE